MNIEFEPERLSLPEARGIVALLLAVHGQDVLVTSNTLMTVKIDGSEAATAVREAIGISLGAEPIVDQDPAAAFGGPQPAAASAPSVSPAPTAPTDGPAFDSAGLPWDERIHSSGRSLVKDGTWRRKGGISDDTYNSVIAELKGAPMSPPAPAPVAPVAPVAPQPPSSTAPAAPTPPPAPPVSPPAAPSSLPPFPAFMVRMAAYQKDGKITLARIGEIAASCGIAQLTGLAQQPDLIPSVEALVMQEIGG